MMTKYYREPEGKAFPQLEEETLLEWREEGLLRKVKAKMAAGEPLVFCDGPPTPNTRPRLSHALIRAVKDAFLRYHIMNGRKVVPFIAGWDCHGLPVEIEVERALGLQGRHDIERLGVDEFNRRCRELVIGYKSDWEAMSERIGYGIDYGAAYMTMSEGYTESVWWALKELHSKGLLEKDFGVVPYCPRCGTTLSSHEVALGYREAEGRFVVVKLRVPELEADILVYTETPWALAANALIAVDKAQTYVVFEQGGERLVASKARLEAVAPGTRPIQELSGTELLGKHYEPFLTHHDFGGKAFRIVHSPDVSSEEGSGAMSVAPPYGSLDFEIGTSEGLELFDPLDEQGRFTDKVPELAGKSAQDAVAEIVKLLETRGRLFRWGIVKRSYPFCWRCYSPLLYRPGESWVVRTSRFKDRMQELNEGIRWVPESLRDGRLGGLLAETKDWVIGRTRYWGTALPVWTCPNGHRLCIGSAEELRAHALSPLPEPLDLHRPYIDKVRLKCTECSEGMSREQFVIDCWFDSACAPFAQYHYPFENMEDFDEHRAVDLVCEDADQTRGWFYTQLALSTMLFDTAAFTTAVSTNHVLDEAGRRMRPEVGNVVYPEEAFSAVGSDAVRLFLLENPVWRPMVFSLERVRKSMVRTMTTLLNVYAFFASNANSYGFRGGYEYSTTHDMDRWILSRLNSTVKEVRSAFDEFEVHRAVNALDIFVEDLSNWYLRQSRRRYWQDSDPQDQFSAQCTLNECLLKLSVLMAPITPFLADWLYRSMHGPEASVHLESFPRVDENAINPTLEAHFAAVDSAIQAGRLARQKVDVKLRQPLSEAVIASDSDTVWVLRRFERMIAEELNVKRVECVDSRERMIQYVVSPNLRTLGPRLKETASELSKLLEKMDGSELVRHLRTKGRVRVGGFDLFEDDIVVHEKERSGYSYARVGDVHVYVALDLSRGLRLEGLSREVVRRIQHMRKVKDLDYDDPIDIRYSAHPEIDSAIAIHKARIMEETQAKTLESSPSLEGSTSWVVDKMPLELVITKARS